MSWDCHQTIMDQEQPPEGSEASDLPDIKVKIEFSEIDKPIVELTDGSSIPVEIFTERRRGRPKKGQSQKKSSGLSKQKKSSGNSKKNHCCTWSGCLMSFPTNAKLTRHTREVHQKIVTRNFVCDWPGCDQRFRDGCDLRQHRCQVHTNEKPFQCPQSGCGFATANRKSIYHHQRYVHIPEEPPEKPKKPKKHSCSWPGCSISFSTNAKLTRHTREVHFKIIIKNFVCDWPGCDQRFRDGCDLKQHRWQVHTNEKPFQCPQPGCGFRTANRGSIYHHQKYVHVPDDDESPRPDKPERFACDWPGCERRFAYESLLKNHVKFSHIKVRAKTHACDWPECDRKFRNAAELRQHLAKHRNEKPLGCDYEGCQFRCIVPKDMKIHKHRMHIKDGPNKCYWPGCEEGFYLKEQLNRHMMQHTGEKRWECPWPGCGQRFMTEDKRHLATHQKTEEGPSGGGRKRKRKKAAEVDVSG